MTLEEIFNNITILEDKSTFNPALTAIVGSILLIVVIIIINIMHYRNWDELYAPPFSIFVIAGCLAFAAFNFWLYNSQPQIIKLQIVTETVSAEQLSEYFTMSEISMGDGQIICDIEPKAGCYDEILTFRRCDTE